MSRTPAALATHFDIAIAGDGLSGLALAVLLADGPWRVLLLAPKQQPAMSGKSDARTTAVAAGPQAMLAAAGAWPAAQAAPITQIRVTDHAVSGPAPNLTFTPHAPQSAFGYIIANQHLRDACWQRIRAAHNITVLSHGVRAAIPQLASTQLTLTNGAQVQAQLLAAADGRNSGLRQAAGIGVRQWGYDQTALVALLQHPLPHGSAALEYFLPTGPLAILPYLPAANGLAQSAMVWTQRPTTAAALAADPAQLVAALNKYVAAWLGPIHAVQALQSWPLSLLHARQYSAPRLVLVGEAAHAIHPVAGQGFNLTMGDLGVLVALLHKTQAQGGDLGSAMLLAQFNRQRRLANMQMAGATDGLVRLFGVRVAAVAALRQWGLRAVTRLPALQRLLTRTASGQAA